MGGKLGTLFARAGHEVVFSYSRSRKKLEDLAREAGVSARAGTPKEAARDADALLIAVHWSRPSLVYCGDAEDAKEVASTLIRDVGFDPVDAGPLRIARYMEPFTLLVAQLAYEGEDGPELAYRLVRFGA